MRNVVVVDIDGVLADYRIGLLYWIRQSVPCLAQKANEHLARPDTWIDAKSMDVTFRKWLDTLESFRMSGGKQSIPVFAGAKEFLDDARSKDLEIVLLTSRPIDIYSNIYRDTVEWLRNNELTHDLLLWSKAKAEIVHKLRLTDRVLFAVDDELKHIIEYDDLGIASYWIDLYKTHASVDGCRQVTRVETIDEINKLLKTKYEK